MIWFMIFDRVSLVLVFVTMPFKSHLISSANEIANEDTPIAKIAMLLAAKSIAKIIVYSKTTANTYPMGFFQLNGILDLRK